jgi:hypothetical protein
MTKTIALAAALTLFAATGAFAQASADQPAAGSTMMKKGAAPKSDAAAMKSENSADASADASAAKPKMHHKMAKNEAQMNEQEAETTKQLNQQQAQYAQNAK